MTANQHNAKMMDCIKEENIIYSPPVPLMSIITSSTENPYTSCSISQAPIHDSICYTVTPTISAFLDNPSSVSTSVERTDTSKFQFAHIIKVPRGTNLIASDNQSTTVCINTTGNIIHLITPTGYHIRSLRWNEVENKITDLLWFEILKFYLIITSRKLYKLKYDSNQSLFVEKLIDFPNNYSSLKAFVAFNSYRLYIHHQSTNVIDIYTLQLVHFQTKQLPDCISNQQIEAFSCSDSFIILHYKHIPNKFVILNPIKMIIEYQLDISYNAISSLNCLNNENTLVFIGIREDGENRLIFLSFGIKSTENKIEHIIVEKSINHNDQLVSLLPRSRDLIILDITAARVQYLKCYT